MEYTGNSFNFKPNYLKNLIALPENVSCSLEVKKLFFKCRMYFKLRKYNIDLKEEKISRKRKLNKMVN